MRERWSSAPGVGVAANLWSSAVAAASNGAATEFCLRGEVVLGARLQGMRPEPGEFSSAE